MWRNLSKKFSARRNISIILFAFQLENKLNEKDRISCCHYYMGACAAHFKHKKQREPLPLSGTPKLNRSIHTPKIISDIRNTSGISCHDRQQVHSIASDILIEKKKESKTKKTQLNERVLNWINENNRDYPLKPPDSMLSLNTLLIRAHEPPQRKTNKQEIIERKHLNKSNNTTDPLS
jgi:hypothetical protein